MSGIPLKAVLYAVQTDLSMPFMRVVYSENEVQHWFVCARLVIQVWLHNDS